MPGVYIGFLLTLPNCKISADSSVIYLVECNKIFFFFFLSLWTTCFSRACLTNKDSLLQCEEKNTRK